MTQMTCPKCGGKVVNKRTKEASRRNRTMPDEYAGPPSMAASAYTFGSVFSVTEYIAGAVTRAFNRYKLGQRHTPILICEKCSSMFVDCPYCGYRTAYAEDSESTNAIMHCLNCRREFIVDPEA